VIFENIALYTVMPFWIRWTDRF